MSTSLEAVKTSAAQVLSRYREKTVVVIEQISEKGTPFYGFRFQEGYVGQVITFDDRSSAKILAVLSNKTIPLNLDRANNGGE